MSLILCIYNSYKSSFNPSKPPTNTLVGQGLSLARTQAQFLALWGIKLNKELSVANEPPSCFVKVMHYNLYSLKTNPRFLETLLQLKPPTR